MDSSQLGQRVRELERELQARNLVGLKKAAERAGVLERELEERRRELMEAQDELDEIKNKEQRQRIQLL